MSTFLGETVEPMTANRAREIIELLWPDHSALLKAAESPIEKLLVAAFIHAGLHGRLDMQPTIGRYRADMVLDGWLVVECDGFQWHYEDEAHVAADLRRTRFMVAQGYTVVRFTGKEIWADANRCAAEVDEILKARAA